MYVHPLEPSPDKTSWDNGYKHMKYSDDYTLVVQYILIKNKDYLLFWHDTITAINYYSVSIQIGNWDSRRKEITILADAYMQYCPIRHYRT